MLKPVILNAKPVCDAQNHSTSRSSPLRERRGGIGHVTAQLAAARGTRLMLVSSDRPRRGDSYGHCGVWGVLFEALCERADRRFGAANIGNAAATSALLAYIVDYHVVPKRVTPGFESHPKGSLALTYVALSAGFALAALLRQRR